MARSPRAPRSLRQEGVEVMTFTRNVASVLRQPRPVTRELAARIADWVNEGGAVDPAGPPPLIDDQGRAKRDTGVAPAAIRHTGETEWLP